MTIADYISGKASKRQVNNILNGSRYDPPRMLMYSHDTYGLGHLRRSLKIAAAFNASCPELRIRLITGSPHAGKYPLPPGMDLVKLPAVVKTGDNRYQARYPGTSFEDVLKLRGDLILETVRTFDPRLMLVDHSPLGMKGELQKSLAWLKEENPQCILALGMRDIIDEPSSVLADWESQGIHDVLNLTYDRIFIYGTPQIFDPVSSYKFGQLASAKTDYTGFIVNPACQATTDLPVARRHDSKHVLLTVGGGEDGADIVAAYLTMLSERRACIDFRSTVLAGPYCPEPMKSTLAKSASALGVEFQEFIPDLSDHLRRADLVVSMGGYNTVTEVLALAQKALIIPRTYPRKEQFLRAKGLSDLGLVSYIPPEELTTDVLYHAVTTLLAGNEQPLVEARQWRMLPLDGASRLASQCLPLLLRHVEVS